MTSRRADDHPVTPDGRYFVVRGRLWRMSNPDLDPGERDELVSQLMVARREVGKALRDRDDEAVAKARQKVDRAKRSLGERGPVWWTDGSPDFNRHLVRNTPYAEWFARLDGRAESEIGSTEAYQCMGIPPVTGSRAPVM